MLGARSYKEFEGALQVLIKSSSISEANSKLQSVPEVESIYNNLIANYQSMAQVDPVSKINFIEIKAPYLMASFVSSIISYLHPQETFFFYENTSEGFTHISMRSQHTQKNLGQLLDTISRQFENAHGGGHAPAAGARCKTVDVEAFKEKVKAAFVA